MAASLRRLTRRRERIPAETTCRLPLHATFALLRFPRPCRRILAATGFGDQLGVLQATANHAHDADQEPARVVVLAFVEPERLLIQIAEQVERLHADVCPLDRALEQ